MSADGAKDLAISTPQKPKPGGRKKRPKVPEEDRKRAVRACDSCRSAKEKCEGGVPCRRCFRLHRICQFHMSMSMSEGSDTRGSDKSSTRPDSQDSSEKLKCMESIVKHFFGDISCDLQNLRRIVEALRSEGPEPLGSAMDEAEDNSDGLSIADEDFTVKELSNNTAHYSGEFSHWSFSQRVQQKIDKLSADTGFDQPEIGVIQEFYRAKNLQSSGSTLVTVAQWFPPQPVSEFLISIFFKYAQTNYYYIGEDWAMAKLESIYSQTSRMSSDDSPAWCILLMLLAVGTQFADLDSADSIATEISQENSSGHDITAGEDVGLTLYKFAVQLIPDVITIASIESVQAFLLLGVYTLPLDTAGLSYTYLGVAIKMAIQNGMHRKYSGVRLDPRIMEIRNRLWWTAYTLEKRICVLHGRPVSVSQSDTDTGLPSDLLDFRPSRQPSNFANIQAMIRLTTQLESIAISMYVIPPSTERIFMKIAARKANAGCSRELRNSGKMQQADLLEELVQHSQRLKEWWLSLPDEIYCRDLDPQKGMFRPNVHLSLTFLLTKVFMGRPFLFTYIRNGESPERPTKSRASSARSALTLDCIEAAFKILDLCQLLHDNGALARASYTEFSSCRAALLVFLAHSLNETTERLRSALTNGMKLLRLMARGIDSAKSELSIVESLSRAVSLLDERSTSQSCNSNSEQHQSSGYEKYKSWAQLWKPSPKSLEGPSDTPAGISNLGDVNNVAGFSGLSVEANLPDSAFDGFSMFPQAVDGFCDLPITNGLYRQDLGGFPDMSLEPCWRGYQVFDFDV